MVATVAGRPFGMTDRSGGTADADTAKHADLPAFPGEDFLAHDAVAWKEKAEARLAGRKLLAVAQGHTPPAVQWIKDTDLSQLPSLPVDHREADYTVRVCASAENLLLFSRALEPAHKTGILL